MQDGQLAEDDVDAGVRVAGTEGWGSGRQVSSFVGRPGEKEVSGGGGEVVVRERRIGRRRGGVGKGILWGRWDGSRVGVKEMGRG